VTAMDVTIHAAARSDYPLECAVMWPACRMKEQDPLRHRRASPGLCRGPEETEHIPVRVDELREGHDIWRRDCRGRGRVGCHVGRLAVSQHLKVLKRAGLVSDRAVGPRRVYEVDQRELEAADMRTSTALE